MQVVEAINGPAKENTPFLSGVSGQGERVDLCLICAAAVALFVAPPCRISTHNIPAFSPHTRSHFQTHTCTHTPHITGHKCPDSFTATGDMASVVSSCEVVLMVVPTPFVARTLAPVADAFRPDSILVSCTKGILNDTLETRECES